MEICAEPFPHAVWDNFIPLAAVRAANAAWPRDGWDKEDGTYQIKWRRPVPQEWRGYTRRLETPDFCRSVADLFGIDEELFVPDDFGAGLHCIPRGGFLRVHTDFTCHPEGWLRRVNLLLYLNEEWRDEWGGHLLLQSEETTKAIAPVGGRAVIFPSTRETWHGHPDPLNCPEDVQRRSLAVYYYSREKGKREKTAWLE